MNTQPLTPQSAGITGPMNINAVITHLIEMTPSQRKQFAQVHMDDPMMLSAAKFVDNQVNKQAQSLAAQQTGAAPPPVNQQAVAQMAGSTLPEDSGIAQLPVENMPQEYARGGIVAFADRGLVDTYPQVGGGQGRRGEPGGGERPPLARQAPAPRVQSAPPPPAYQAASYVPKDRPSLEQVFQKNMDSQGPVVDPYAAQRAEAGASRQAIAQRALEGVKERESGIEALLSKKEERVAEREERLKGQEGINLNMSLINAGLSMMQSTGKGLAGIAEGAQKGVSQYSEGLRLSEAARQKIEEARDAHDDLRFNLKNMSSKERQAAEGAIEEAKIVTTLEAISGLEKAYGISHNKAVALFGAEINERTAESNREYQAFEAAEGRKFTGSQTDKQIAASAAQSALERAARAGDAAASRALQERLAKMPDANQRFYASLSPTGNVREGYAYAMEQRGESATSRDVLARAEKFLENPLNQRSNPELWKQAQDVVARSFTPILDSSNVNGPVLPKPQR